MRIFEVIEFSTNLSVPTSRTWYRNLYESLVEMGHDVVLFSAEEGRRAMQRNDRRARADFSEKLLNNFRCEHAKKPFDLFFAYLMDGMVETGVIDEIRKTGVPTCNFSCNNTHQFYLVAELSLHFDYNLHSEKDAREKFLAIGANPVWWPMAANPRYYKPYDVPRTIDVSFVGANYAKRPYYIWNLLENGIDVHVYGPGWSKSQGGFKVRLIQPLRRVRTWFLALASVSTDERALYSAQVACLAFCDRLLRKYEKNLHSPVSDEEMVLKHSESRISLGFLEVFNRHDPSGITKQHVHLREFEAPMSGALYITGFCEELEEFYEPDKEVVIYRNEYELLNKVRYYLSRPVEAERVRQAGTKRAQECHTYQKRFTYLFDRIGLSGRLK
jgi:spore maturation protein CgeB